MGDQCLIKKKKKILGQNKFNHIKLRLLQFLQMLLILIMNKNVPLHPNSSYYQMCISKRQKSDIIIIIIINNNQATQTCFLIWNNITH